MFDQLVDDFSKISELDDIFHPELIKRNVGWMDKRNRKALGITKSFGKRYGDGHVEISRHEISLNPALMQFEDDGFDIIADTIAHELVHTCDGCQNHGAEFHRVAKIVNDRLGYKIDTRADIDASNYFTKYLPKANYILKCPECERKWDYQRKSNATENPWQYSCPNCKVKLDSYKLNKNTNEYELYKSGSDRTLSYPYWIRCDNCDYAVPFMRRDNTYKTAVQKILAPVIAFGADKVQCPKCKFGHLYAVDNGITIDDEIVYNVSQSQFDKLMKTFGLR